MTEPGKELELRELSPKQRQAAVLEAAGVPRTQIAEAVGVSAKTLTAWGKREDYSTAVTEAAGSQLARIEARVEALQVQAVHAAELALDRLVEALEAKDEYDRPYWKIVVDAARELSSNPTLRAIVDPKGAAGSGQVSVGVTLVRIQTDEGGEKVIEFEDVIEGEVEEDVEPGQTAED